MSYMKKINPSNTTLSYNRKNTKYDIEQAKRHNHGKAYCDICNEMFTKTSWNAKRCSDKCKRAYKKEWLIENKERIAQQKKEYCKNNKDKLKQQHKEYFQKNKDKLILKQRQRREERRKKDSGVVE